MTPTGSAAAWAEQQVASVRDDPGGRIALMQRCYYGPFGKAPRHLPFRRAAMSFMRWQLRRGLLQPLSSDRPGSPWWRAVNQRILRDGCEAVALSGDLTGPVSSQMVDFWMSFADYPTARAWYRAHNGSVVAAYLERRDLAEAENEAERFFMNVVLCRVLYAHALVAAPRISLGWLRPLGPLLGDPRLGMTGIFLQLSRVLPDEYPLKDSARSLLGDELGFGRLLDYGVIAPRLQQLYEWSAHELAAPGLLECVPDGAMTYAWSLEIATCGSHRSHSSSTSSGGRSHRNDVAEPSRRGCRFGHGLSARWRAAARVVGPEVTCDDSVVTIAQRTLSSLCVKRPAASTTRPPGHAKT